MKFEKLRQKRLAELLGISPTQLSSWLLGGESLAFRRVKLLGALLGGELADEPHVVWHDDPGHTD